MKKKIISQIFPCDSSWNLVFPFFFFILPKELCISFFTNLLNRVKEDKDTIFKRFVQKVFIFCIFREERKIIFPWSVNDERTDSFNGVSGKSIHL